MFDFTDYKVLCRDCDTVYPFNQISPTRDFSNLQHVALPFFEEHCSTTMKFALIAPALLSLAVAGPLPSSEGVHVLTKRQTRPIGSCDPGPNFCGFSLEECNTQLAALRAPCTNRCIPQGLPVRVECLAPRNLGCFC
jgi:hypothetical protein